MKRAYFENRHITNRVKKVMRDVDPWATMTGVFRNGVRVGYKVEWYE